MNLYFSTYILAAAFAAAAFALVATPAAAQKFSFNFIRSKTAAVVVAGSAIAWFVYILSQLGEADFGNIKILLIALFGGAGLLAFRYLPDFLSVRGAAVIALLSCREFIDSAYMQEPQSRLLMVSICYIIVLMSLYFGAIPYRSRDFLNWLFAKNMRVKAMGLFFLILAFALIGASFMY